VIKKRRHQKSVRWRVGCRESLQQLLILKRRRHPFDQHQRSELCTSFPATALTARDFCLNRPLQTKGDVHEQCELVIMEKIETRGLSPSQHIDDRSEEATSTIELSGVIKWFNVAKGYGFIVPDNGMSDVFLGMTCLRRGGFGVAQEGTRLSSKRCGDRTVCRLSASSPWTNCLRHAPCRYPLRRATAAFGAAPGWSRQG
jgi:cold shock CspA family protein